MREFRLCMKCHNLDDIYHDTSHSVTHKNVHFYHILYMLRFQAHSNSISAKWSVDGISSAVYNTQNMCSIPIIIILRVYSPCLCVVVYSVLHM